MTGDNPATTGDNPTTNSTPNSSYPAPITGTGLTLPPDPEVWNRFLAQLQEYLKHHPLMIQDRPPRLLLESSLTPQLLPPPKPLMEVTEKIQSLADLIQMAEKYAPHLETHRFGFDLRKVVKMLPLLKEFQAVIGMTQVKTQVLDQIISSLLDLYEPTHRFHTVIQGPPGVGKTMLAKILGRIYLHLGILSGNDLKFHTATRSDLVGRYLGHTAVKTQELIDRCEGGVLFIDEVYSLGNPQQRDSFAKECIDTLNLNLTEKPNFVCIIAGYPEEIEQCFFSMNPGLRRRFSFTYRIEKYNPEEMAQIFLGKVKSLNWTCTPEAQTYLRNLLPHQLDQLPHFGGDLETWLLRCQSCHGRRIFGLDPAHRRILTRTDLQQGWELYLQSRPEEDDFPTHLYL